MKSTDYKLTKMYLCERMLPEYNAISLKNVIDRIIQQVYYEKLKKGATKNFMRWVKKELEQLGVQIKAT